jgi:predicted tellurium resistance membrane protein TerC
MQELIQQILDNPGPSLAIIGNLIIIESLLSVDNAAVLATMVMDLPEKQRDKALKYGIWGAYIFRGLAMIFAAFSYSNLVAEATRWTLFTLLGL